MTTKSINFSFIEQSQSTGGGWFCRETRRSFGSAGAALRSAKRRAASLVKRGEADIVLTNIEWQPCSRFGRLVVEVLTKTP